MYAITRGSGKSTAWVLIGIRYLFPFAEKLVLNQTGSPEVSTIVRVGLSSLLLSSKK